MWIAARTFYIRPTLSEDDNPTTAMARPLLRLLALVALVALSFGLASASEASVEAAVDSSMEASMESSMNSGMEMESGAEASVDHEIVPALGAMAQTGANILKGSGLASEKESCFACKFLLRKAYIMSGRDQAQPEDFQAALTTICDEVPPVFLQGCQTLVELKQRVSKEILIYKSDFENTCLNAQLCWLGLMGM